MIRGVNWQAGNGPTSLPKLVIVDNGSSPGTDGWMYRTMNWRDCRNLAADSIVQLWNEDDSCTGQEERMDAITFARSYGLKVVYGGDRVDPSTGWSKPPDPLVLGDCDYYGIHCATWATPPLPLMYGKPVIVTEVEQDPEHVDWDVLLQWMAKCQCPAFYFTWAWRNGDSRINLSGRPDVAARLDLLNSQENDGMDPTVQQVLDQNAHIAQGMFDLVKSLEAFAAGKPSDGGAFLQDAKAHVNALNPDKFVFSDASPNS